jgi:hypothetical protein
MLALCCKLKVNRRHSNYLTPILQKNDLLLLNAVVFKQFIAKMVVYIAEVINEDTKCYAYQTYN